MKSVKSDRNSRIKEEKWEFMKEKQAFLLKMSFLCGLKIKISKFHYMLIIERKDEETIDRALKRYKNKHRKVGVVTELRRRKHFTKPSVTRRAEVLKAVYKKKKFGNDAL